MISLIIIESFSALFFSFSLANRNVSVVVIGLLVAIVSLVSCEAALMFVITLQFVMKCSLLIISLNVAAGPVGHSTFSCCFTFPFILMAVQPVSLRLYVISLGCHCLLLLDISVNIFHCWLNSCFCSGAVSVTPNSFFPPRYHSWTLRHRGVEVRGTTPLIHWRAAFQNNIHF